MKKRIIFTFFALLMALSVHAQQLYNMSLDSWSKSAGAWNPYGAGVPESNRVWDTANHGLSLLGINGTVPEYKHVAVSGKGKAAAKIESKNVLWAFVAGNLFTGRFVRIVKTSGAVLDFGVPFKSRPKSISGYVHYIPKTIDFAKEPYKHLKGTMDKGYVEVVLTDWDSPDEIDSTKDKFKDGATDPHVIGRAFLVLDKDTGGYVHFDIPIEYRNGKTPKYAVITATSSKYGAYFTGADGSILYLDELHFNY